MGNVLRFGKINLEIFDKAGKKMDETRRHHQAKINS